MAVNVCFRVKMGQSEKSIFNSFRPRTLFVMLIIFGTWVSVDAKMSEKCTAVSDTFGKKHMLNYIEIQEQPTSDVGGLCLNQGCCKASSKKTLVDTSRTALETALKNEIMKLSTTLSSKASKFDDFFRAIFDEAKREFHAMFKKTYGMIYEQHSYLFENLFDRLQQYYDHGNNDLGDVMDSFFSVLYEKMFTVLNAQYKFDDNYLKCVGKHMRDTKPFEDVPQKLSAQLRRAFVATRTFYKALRIGSEVATSMLKVQLKDECINGWTRMTQCGACGGFGITKPCSRYCHNVLNGCLPKHADMSDDWDAYVDSVDKVADRLLGPFNIVMVVEPIDIKISEAIMHFQEHNTQISEKIFDGCGRPSLGSSHSSGKHFVPRNRRSIRSMPEYDWQKSAETNDFELEASFESVLNEDPMLLSLDSSEDITKIVNKMKQQAVLRDKFIKYMRGEVSLDDNDNDNSIRIKRDAEAEADAKPSSAEILYKQYAFNGKKKGGKRIKDKNTSQATSSESTDFSRDETGEALERLVRDCKIRVRNSKRFFSLLPYVLCSGVGSDPGPHQPCFNGTHNASYTLTAAGSGSRALDSNPEVRPGPDSAEDVTLPKLALLKMITSKLKDAYNGVNVTWEDEILEVSSSNLALNSDDSDYFETRQGSGSGDGFGDDEDFGTQTEGSGSSPISSYPEEELPRSPEITTFSPPVVSDIPRVVPGGDESRNVRIGSNPLTPDQDQDQDLDLETRYVPEQNNNEISELPSSATSVSVQRALLSLAAPVVCAWFGSIVMDLF